LNLNAINGAVTPHALWGLHLKVFRCTPGRITPHPCILNMVYPREVKGTSQGGWGFNVVGCKNWGCCMECGCFWIYSARRCV